MTITKDVHRKK